MGLNMSFGGTSQSTDDRIVAKSHAYVVFDKTTGEILHIHHSVAFPEGATPRVSPESRARRFAGEKAEANADVLKVDSAEVNHHVHMRVDTVKRTVVRK
jgi:hypothetical protein